MPEYLSPLAAPFFFQGSRNHAVLLIHGFTASPAQMRWIGRRLNEHGFTVCGICLPGHCTRMEDMRNVSWKDWLNAAADAFGQLKKQYEAVSVAGLSMGGVLALILAETLSCATCTAISAPMDTTNRFRRLALPLSLVYPTVHKRPDAGRAVALPAEYDVCYDSFPTKSTHDLSVLMNMARKDLSAIHCPLLIVQSHGDKTVSQDSLSVILRGASSADKRTLWLNSAPHVCTISNEWEKITDAMLPMLG